MNNGNVTVVTDRSGHTMFSKSQDGVNYPVMSFVNMDAETGLSEIRNYQSQPGDVVIASYPKSGTCWVYNIVYMLLSGKCDHPQEVTFVDHALGLSDTSVRRQYATHLLFSQLPIGLVDKNCKVINIVRNPKDTAVSLYHFMLKMKQENYSGSWEDFLDLFMNGKAIYGSWFTYVKEWWNVRLRHPRNCLQIYYEDLKNDLLGSIKSIADFIEVPYTNSFLEEITGQCSFEKLKAATISNSTWRDKSHDGKNPIFRKGVIGDWKSWFTVNQNRIFEERYRREMMGIPLCFQYI